MLPIKAVKLTKLEIRDNLTINIRPWLGKDLNLFPSILTDESTVSSLTDEDILNLISPCIENYNDIYFTRYELLYILFQLRMISLTKDYNYDIKCTVSDCKGTIKGIVDLNDSKYEKMDTEQVVLSNSIVYMNGIIKNSDFDIDSINDIFTLHINTISIEGETYSELTLLELKKFVEELPVDDYIALIEHYNKKCSFFEVYSEHKCSECDKDYIIQLDELPNFLYY